MSESSRPVAILTALREELRAIHPHLRQARLVRYGALRYWTATLWGRNVVVARTGIGWKNASAKCALLIEAAHPLFLIATGFAGGLRPGLRAGDILVAREVCEFLEEPSSSAKREPSSLWRAPKNFLDAAESLATPLKTTGQELKLGRLVTVGRVLSKSSEKEKLGAMLEADAADMESSGMLKVTSEQELPAICVRAILDEWDLDLPFDFGKIVGPDGTPRLFGALQAFAERPGGVFKLLDLRTRALKAIKSLEVFIPKLVEVLT